MLASHMASISQASKSGFLVQATIAPSIAIVRSTRLPPRHRHQQQFRSFRIGLWSSYLDPAFQKELQRRNRVIKHKYTEALNRKLSWDRRLPVYATRWGLKGFMCSSWRAHDPRPGGRWVNVDEVREVKDDSTPSRGRGIEDAEQDALDKLLGRKDAYRSMYRNGSFEWSWAANDSTPTHSGGMRYRRETESKPDREFRSRQEWHTTGRPEPSSNEQEYVIDPITNRKVFGKSKTQAEKILPNSEATVTEIPVKKFKGYRSQYSQFEPPAARVEKKVIQVDDGNVLSAALAGQSTSQDLQDEVEKYKPFKYNEPDGKPPNQGDAATDNLRAHDHLYKPFKYNEPDGKLPEKPDCVSECLSDFDHQYKPFRYNEPDGKLPEQPDPVKMSLKEHDHQAEHESNHRIISASTKTDGQQSNDANISRQDSWLSQEGFSSNADLGRGERTAGQHKQNENMEIERSLNRSSQSLLSDLGRDAVEKQEDIDLLRASDIRAASGILKAPRKETQLEKDRRRIALEAEFDRIQARASSLAEEIAASQKVKESRQLAQDLELERSYLLNFNAHAKGRVDAKIAELDAEMAAEKAHSDAQKRVTGNFVRDFPEEFSATWSTKESSTNSCLLPNNGTDAWGYNKSPKGLELSYQQEMESEVQSAENDSATDVASKDGSDSTKVETALYRSLKASKSKAQAEHDPYSKEPQGLETSYTEEAKEQGDSAKPMFVKSYGCNTNAQRDKDLVRDIRNIYESKYGTIDCNHRQIHETPEAPETFELKRTNNELQEGIQNLEHLVCESQHELNERYTDVAKALAKQASNEEHETAAKGEESLSASKGLPAADPLPKPTVYKILAYDPVMQTIQMAETTSIVNDTSSALTPAEVLLRLSNPAKFFPHFQPLQSQGYEIASGSGDVLVFRKVREGNPTASSIPHIRKVINPIDGMQSVPQPATGNFASPTGFVNHDLPSDNSFISGIDVRREEPVFSGRKTVWQDGDNEKQEPGRRSKKVGRGLLVGAVWVAACSYAVGVVAEFFKTGGSDGKGPVRF